MTREQKVEWIKERVQHGINPTTSPITIAKRLAQLIHYVSDDSWVANELLPLALELERGEYNTEIACIRGFV